MPTESTFFLAGLLFVAAALGYLFARLSDFDEDQQADQKGTLNADYVKGLNFLLNEQPDQALEVFMRMVEVDDETLETHFALGSLFRRRGEFERAIRVHQNIVARPNLSNTHKDQAIIALADDYLSAGLYDRAEKFFKDLAENPDHRSYALQKLIYIYEVTHDWEQAIRVCQELQKAEPEGDDVGRVAHYYCELAETAVAADNLELAHDLLKKAEASNTEPVRAELALADLDQAAGNHDAAIKTYQKVMELRPNLIVDVIPKLAASCRATDDQELLSDILNKLRNETSEHLRTIALAVVHDQNIVNATALDCLYEYVASEDSLSHLVDVAALDRVNESERASELERIREGLRLLDSQRLRYQCRNCGYSTSVLIWQCPSCRTWESVVPSQGNTGL